MARGLELARAHGVASLEDLIESLLLGRVEQSGKSAGATTGAMAAQSVGPVDPQLAVPDAGVAVSPPAITLALLDGPPPAPFAADVPPSTLALPFLTNRLSPLKASARALANLAIRDGEWPRLRDFQARAGHVAREHGLRLLAEDRAAGRRGRQKRSVAWPIGANPASALERFAFAFTLAQDGTVATGPLVVLGLATVQNGRAVLTEVGWQLARASSPAIDGGDGTLGAEEATILRAQLLASPAESRAIAEFVNATRRAAGAQPRIDELLGVWHSEWSSEQAGAQRSAMIGRLEELGLISVTGRGTKAIVELHEVGAFEAKANERSAA